MEFCSLCRNWSHLYLCLRFSGNETACRSAAVQMFLPLADKMIHLVYCSNFELKLSGIFIEDKQAEGKILAFWQNTACIQSCSYHNWELAISCPDGEQIVSCCLKRRLVSPLFCSKVPRWGEDMHYFTWLTTLLEMSSLETYGIYLQKQNNWD